MRSLFDSKAEEAIKSIKDTLTLQHKLISDVSTSTIDQCTELANKIRLKAKEEYDDHIHSVVTKIH